MRLYDFIMSLKNVKELDEIDLSGDDANPVFGAKITDREITDKLPIVDEPFIFTKTLRLRNNKISKLAAVNHLLQLCDLSSLEALDLSDNALTFADDIEEIKRFCELLKGATHLKEICLTNNKISGSKLVLINLQLMKLGIKTPPFTFDEKEIKPKNSSHNYVLLYDDIAENPRVAEDSEEEIQIIDTENAINHDINNNNNNVNRKHYGTLARQAMQRISNIVDANDFDANTLALFKRFLFKEQLPWQLVEKFLLRKNESFNNQRRNETQLRKILLPNQSPLDEESAFKAISHLQNLQKSFHQFTHELLPVTLSAFLLHDLAAFSAQPNYDTTSADVFSGFCRQSWGWLCYQYDGFPNESAFWLLQTSLTLLPIVATGVNFALHKRTFEKPEDLNQVFSDVIAAYGNNAEPLSFSLSAIKERLAFKKVKPFLPFSSYRKALRTADIHLNWRNAKDNQHYAEWLDKIITIANAGPLVLAIPAIITLANIANNINNYQKQSSSIRDEEISLLIPNNLRASSQQLHFSQIAANALTDLAHNAQDLRKEVAGYERWTLGQSTERNRHILYGALWAASAAMVGFSAYRLSLFVVGRYQQAAVFNNQQKECEAQGKVYAYSTMSGEMECAVCPDWRFVPPQEANDPQMCLTRLLRANQTLPQLQSHLPRLMGYQNLNVLDLTRWSPQLMNWDTSTTQQFFNQVFSLAPGWRYVNISMPTATMWPNNGNMLVLANEMNNVRIENFICNGLNLGTQQWCEFLTQWNNPEGLIGLHTNNMNIMDQGMYCTTNWINNHNITLSDASFDYNGLTNRGVENFLAHFNPQYAHNFSIRFNQLDGDVFLTVGPWVANSNLNTFDGSGNDFTGGNYALLGQGFSQAHQLENIKLDNVGAIDDDIADLCQQNQTLPCKNFSIQGNQVTGLGASICAEYMPNAYSVNFANNMIDDDSFPELQANLNKTNWFNVVFSYNPISENTIANFWSSLTNTSIRAVHFAGMNADESAFAPLLPLIARGTVKLEELSVNDNLLSNQFARDLINTGCQNGMIKINVGKNSLTAIFTDLPQQTANTMTCQELILDQNPLEKEDVQTLVSQLPKQKAISHISVKGCQNVDNDIALQIAETVLTPIKNTDQLTHGTLSYDMDRSLNRSHADTGISKLDLQDTAIDAEGAIPLRHVADHLPELDIELEDEFGCDLYDCQTSSASTNKPWLSHLTMWQPARPAAISSSITSTNSNFNPNNSANFASLFMSVVPGVIVLYLLYIMMKKLYNSNETYEPRLWQNRSSQERQEAITKNREQYKR